jgi:hypothetical protein
MSPFRRLCLKNNSRMYFFKGIEKENVPFISGLWAVRWDWLYSWRVLQCSPSHCPQPELSLLIVSAAWIFRQLGLADNLKTIAKKEPCNIMVLGISKAAVILLKVAPPPPPHCSFSLEETRLCCNKTGNRHFICIAILHVQADYLHCP